MDDKALRVILEPIIAARGLELDRLDVLSAGKRQVLRISVDGDGPRGHGPVLDQISDVTRDISVALDETDASGKAPFTLEVSSRGVSSPLTDPKHFRRNVTRLVKLTLDTGELMGRIVEADDDAVTLNVKGQRRVVAYASIAKAVVQIEMNRPKGLDDVDDEDFVEDDVDDDFVDDEEEA